MNSQVASEIVSASAVANAPKSKPKRKAAAISKTPKAAKTPKEPKTVKEPKEPKAKKPRKPKAVKTAEAAEADAETADAPVKRGRAKKVKAQSRIDAIEKNIGIILWRNLLHENKLIKPNEYHPFPATGTAEHAELKAQHKARLEEYYTEHPEARPKPKEPKPVKLDEDGNPIVKPKRTRLSKKQKKANERAAKLAEKELKKAARAAKAAAKEAKAAKALAAESLSDLAESLSDLAIGV